MTVSECSYSWCAVSVFCSSLSVDRPVVIN